MYARKLNRLWLEIPLKKSKLRNESPLFKIDIKSINKEINLIVIKIPTAKEELEAYYLGVAYDENYNVRYFTYEVTKGPGNDMLYALCEWTKDWSHINYGFYPDNNIATFTNNIEIIYKKVA